jgi:pyrimidine-nucleoside phosphorylase
MSGRGLGHTGGTLDKLESIKDFSISLSVDEFESNVNKIKIAVVGQTGNLAPADKKIYALRDVTATVESIPLIASSIMSKKIAGGADAIVLDVKYGDGAFMKTIDDATNLAQAMVDIGTSVGRKTVAVISNMNEPLGFAIGNALEVKEAIDTLKGNGPRDFEEVCIELASQMLYLAGCGEIDELKIKVKELLYNGKAFDKFCEFIKMQGGDINSVLDVSLLPSASKVITYCAKKSGYISKIEAEKLGIASMLLGGGRAKKTDSIDYGVGIVLEKKVGEFINEGDRILTLHVDNEEKLNEVVKILDEAFCYDENEVVREPLIAKVIV